MTLEEAKQFIDFEILTPEYLPEGYEFNYSMVSSSKDMPYSTFVHSGFSVFAGQHYEKKSLSCIQKEIMKYVSLKAFLKKAYLKFRILKMKENIFR